MKLKSLFYIFLICILGNQNFFAEDSRSLDEILSSGVVRIGVRKSPTVYMENETSGLGEGYVWDLISAWAEENGIKAEPVFLNSMIDYWTQNGEIPENVVSNEALIYTPDIYNKIDLAADIFSPLTWRKRLVDMHKYIDVGNILVARKDDHIKNPQDLIGKLIYVVKGLSGYELLVNYLEENSLPYKEIAISIIKGDDDLAEIDIADPEVKISTTEVNLLYPVSFYRMRPLAFYQWLLNDQVDLLINNSLTFFIYNNQNNSMRRYLEPTLALSETLDNVCITSPKNSIELSLSLKDFLERSQSNGLNNRLLLKHAGIGLTDYNELIRKK